MSSKTKVVVGTDGTATATKAFEEALALAKKEDAELHVVSVVRIGTPLAVEPSEAMMGEVVAQGIEAAHDSAEATLDYCKSIAEKEGLSVKTHSIDGDPAHALVMLCERLEADHLVVGNRGMQGIRGMFPSVPKSVSKKAPCTVHIVKTT